MEERLTATIAAGLSTVQLTGEDPDRAAAAMAVLRGTGYPLPDTDVARAAEWWSDHLADKPADEPALRVQRLRVGIEAFTQDLKPTLVQPAVMGAAEELLAGAPALQDLASVAALAEAVGRLGPDQAPWRQTGDQVRQAVAQHLKARPQLCRTVKAEDTLLGYTAVRELSALGYDCAMPGGLESAARAEIGRLVASEGTWAVPEAILLTQVGNAGQGDRQQSAEDIEVLRKQAQGALRELLSSDGGSQYRGMPASLTELSMAVGTLTGWTGQPADVRLARATARAMADIVLLRGRIPDTPEDNSAIDGYLAAVARAQLTDSPVALGSRPKPVGATGSASDQVRFYLDASLRAGKPLRPSNVRRDTGAFLNQVRNPLDRLTVTAAATFALQRTEEPCAVVDQQTPQLKEALAQAIEQFAPGNAAVRGWLTLLWSNTQDCSGFRQQTGPELAAFLEGLRLEPGTADPTAQAVAAWGVSELTCLKDARSIAPKPPVSLAAFAKNDSDPGDGLGLGVYAALRTQNSAAEPCSGSLKEGLRSIGGKG